MTALACLMLCVTSLPAAAQPAPNSGETRDLDTAPVDDALEAYWGQKSERDAVVHRTLDRQMRHEITLFNSFVPNDPFNSYYPIGARYDFYFLDWLGMELWGGYMIRVTSDLGEFLKANFNASLLQDIPPSLEWFAGVNLMFAPLHGKFAMFGSKLTHFDGFLTLGGGPVGTKSRNPAGETESSVAFGGNFGIGVRLRFIELLGVRLEYRQHIYDAKGGSNAFPAEISLGVSLWL